MTAAFDLDAPTCRVSAQLEDLRTSIGMKDRALFESMTMEEVRAASMLRAWCALGHGGHRVAGCAVCRELAKRGE